MSRHDELKKQWAPGQVWETRLDECEQWVRVGANGLAQPLWDEHQQYRRAAEAQQWKIGDEFLPFHPQASHVPPEYRDGWNACYRAALSQGAKP